MGDNQVCDVLCFIQLECSSYYRKVHISEMHWDLRLFCAVVVVKLSSTLNYDSSYWIHSEFLKKGSPTSRLKSTVGKLKVVST